MGRLILGYSGYLYTMANDVLAKGAFPIISSQTPNGPDQTDTVWAPAPPRFVGYAESAAQAAGVAYADHWKYMAKAFTALGLPKLKTFYPNGVRSPLLALSRLFGLEP
jgi:rhamnogalacturonan acetylesterase